MNKKLIALAVAGATLVPMVASAQSANPVTLYGRVYPIFESVKADGGTAVPVPTRNRVSDNGPSFVGVRGTEDVGGGLKAFFQVEFGVRLDDNVTTIAVPVATPPPGTLNNTPITGRNSGVGLQGDFGSILLGRWDTPMKTASVKIDPWEDTTIGGQQGTMGDRGNFNRRENNVVEYWTPNMSGFEGRVSYAANEGRTATVNPSSTSFSATYNQGPFYVAYTYENHKDQYKSYTSGLTFVAGGSERAQGIIGQVIFGNFKLAAMAQKYKKANPANGIASQNTEARAQSFAATYTANKNQFIYTYNTSKDSTFATVGAAALPAEAVCKTNTGGYKYLFSKRTTFVAQYVIVKNNATGLCNFGANTLAIAADQDPRGFSVGFKHLF